MLFSSDDFYARTSRPKPGVEAVTILRRVSRHSLLLHWRAGGALGGVFFVDQDLP
jgi:hypothetical protein